MRYRHHACNDRWIAEAVFAGMRGGYFVEAGAGGGKGQSATYVLETELGWDGICVEPVDKYYEMLQRTRRCHTDNRCLWRRGGESVSFTSFPERLPRSGISEVNKNLDAERAAGSTERTVTKETVTLHELLVAYDAPATVHYVGLDLEGAERHVVEAFDFREGPHRVLALSVEGRSCDDLMRDAGYAAARNPFTDVRFEHYFLHPDLAEERPELVAG